MAEPVQSRFGNIDTLQHTHPDVPKVFVQPSPPTAGMVRGDIWSQTQPVAAS